MKALNGLLILAIQFGVFAYSAEGLAASYGLEKNWPELPAGEVMGQVTGVAVDSHNHVFVFHRGSREWETPFPSHGIEEDTVLMFEGDSGRLINSWGADLFIMPHGLSVDAENRVWVTDVGTHQLHQFSHDGEWLISLGESGVRGDDQSHFARPTDIATDRNGNVFVSDGYQNDRVVRFDSQGQYLDAWGDEGSAEGEFRLPHAVALSEKFVYVADRSNSRLQIFDHQGGYITEWTEEVVGRPYGVSSMSNGRVAVVDGGGDGVQISRVIILDERGEVLEAFDASTSGDQQNLGHDIAVGGDDAVYVADILAPSIRKFSTKPK